MEETVKVEGRWGSGKKPGSGICQLVNASPVPYCLLQPLRAAVWEERAAPAAGGKWEEWEEEEGRAPGGWEPASLSAPFRSPLQLCFCSSPEGNVRGAEEQVVLWAVAVGQCPPPPSPLPCFCLSPCREKCCRWYWSTPALPCLILSTSKLMNGQLKQKWKVAKDKISLASSLDVFGLGWIVCPTRSR